MTSPKYSIVIPVYNRPQEVEELLESLTKQVYKNFEVLVVEDGSTITCEKVFEKYVGKLTISYFFKPNTGPGPSRNFGFEKAKGEYLVVFDSDCIIPPQYLEEIELFLKQSPLDAWGGSDRAHTDFTSVQRAMGYTMSSVLTTGGIRGGKSKDFQPRSFNMGISKAVFQKSGGFKFDRFAEDIEFSIRMKKAGFKIGLIPEAYVYHKRRADFRQFYHQVYNFGRGRVLVGKVHPEGIKITHWFPSLFLLGFVFSVLFLPLSPNLGLLFIGGYGLYFLIIGVHAYLANGSIEVALLSMPAAAIQLMGYGAGFLREMINPIAK